MRRAPRTPGAGERRLGQEAAGRSVGERDAQVPSAAAGGEYDGGRVLRLCEPPRDVEPRNVREQHVEQNGLRPEPQRCVDRAGPVRRLADDGEACFFQQATRELPKGRMVVDDQHSPVHVRIVSQSVALFSPGFP